MQEVAMNGLFFVVLCVLILCIVLFSAVPCIVVLSIVLPGFIVIEAIKVIFALVYVFLHERHIKYFNEWRLSNPGVYISLSPQGTLLVWNMIRSCLKLIEYEHYLDVDQFKDRLAILYDLLNEGPPPARDDIPAIASLQRRLVFLYMKRSVFRVSIR